LNHRDTESTEIRRLRSKISGLLPVSVVRAPARSALSVAQAANHDGHRPPTAVTTETWRREGLNHRDTESTEIRRLRSKISVLSVSLWFIPLRALRGSNGQPRRPQAPDGGHHGDLEEGRVEPQRHGEHRESRALSELVGSFGASW
jgi:hypothetical protein